MAATWQNVHIFISSTFNDMHAERDYLVKQVFPRLREWCEQRKLNLIDIDLRWGVTEEDATLNKRVVEVCLERIDACRPFFLCFMGQRRGWVPRPEDISEKTFESFPALREFLNTENASKTGDLTASPSVTEMEILHAVINPLHFTKSQAFDPHYEKTKYAFFYFRDDHYLNDLPTEPVQIRQTYTNQGIADLQEKNEADQILDLWRKKIIPNTNRPIHDYQAEWNPEALTPELAFPFTCPTSNVDNIRRWRERWAEVGVQLDDRELTVSQHQLLNAQNFNQSITKGRLTDFMCQGKTLSDIIYQDLTQAIEERFPEHMQLVEDTPLQREIDQQEQFVQSAVDGFIQREGDFDDLNAYIQDGAKHTFAVVAPGGLGKSTLLAKWIDRLRMSPDTPDQVVLFRFIGASDSSTSVYSLLHSLLEQFAFSVNSPDIKIPIDSQQLRETWIKIIQEKNAKRKKIIVLDALNQLEEGLSDLSWLPGELPENIKLVVSFKQGSTQAEDLIHAMRESGQAKFGEVIPFESLEERRKLVQGFLKPYLKDLGQVDMDKLIQLPGADNPLYLKILLSELRVFGVFSELTNKIAAFGENPVSAFINVLKRLETDPAYSRFRPDVVVPLIFGSLAYARHGLSAHELADLLLQVLHLEKNTANYEDAFQTVQLFFRQVRPFLARRDGCYDFFYESFKLAAFERYTKSDIAEISAPRRSQMEWHHQLADYFKVLPLWSDASKRIANKRKTAELPFHLAMSAQPNAFTECLGNYDFLYAKILASSAPVLLEDFKLASLDQLALESQSAGELSLIQKAITLSLQNISFDPRMFAGQLIARLDDFGGPIVQRLVQQAKNWTDEIWIRPLTTRYKQPDSELNFSFAASGHYLYRMQVTADGKRLVTLSQDMEKGALRIKLWDAKNGKLIRQTNLKEGVMHADINVIPDDHTIFLISHKELIFYNADHLNIERSFPINGNTMGPRILFHKISPGGQFGYVIEQDKLRAVDFGNGKRLDDLLSLGTREILDFKFSRSGKYCAVVLGRERIIQVEGKQVSKAEYYQHNANDKLFVFEAGSNHALLVSLESVCCDRLFFTADEEALLLVNEAGRIDLLRISDQKTISRLDGLTDLQYQSTMQGFKNPYGISNTHPGAGKIEITPDGKKAICCVGQGYLKVLDITKDAIQIIFDLYSPEPVQSLAILGNSLAISTSLAKEMNVWDLYAGKMVKRLQDNAPIKGFEGIADDRQIHVISRNDQNLIRFWDLSDITGQPKTKEKLEPGSISPIYNLLLSPGGEAACALKKMFIQVIDTHSYQELAQLKAAPPPTADMQFYPDQARLTSVSIDGTVQTWLYRTGKSEKIARLKHLGAGFFVNSVALAGGGRWLVNSDTANRLQMIDLENEMEYEFACEPVLSQVKSLINTDLLVLKYRTMPWGRSSVTLLPGGSSVISFSYIPHFSGSQPPDHLRGNLDTTEEFVEIHDLKTGCLKQRFSDRDFVWCVLSFKTGHSDQIVYQSVAKKRRGLYGEMSEFCLETLDVQTGTRNTLVSRATPILDFDVARDEQRLVLLTNEGVIEVWSIPSNQMLAHFKGDQVCRSCALTDDGKTILVGDEGGAVNFLRIENDQSAHVSISNMYTLPGEIASAWTEKIWPVEAINPPLPAVSRPVKAVAPPPGQSISPLIIKELKSPAEQIGQPGKSGNANIPRIAAKTEGPKPRSQTLFIWLSILILVILLIAAYILYDQVLFPTPDVFLTPLPQATRTIP